MQGGQPTWVWGGNDSSNMYVYNPSNFSVNYANGAGTVKGSYTYNGGQQNPNYFGVNKVGFLMMNTTVNGDDHYKDWIIMDCYSGSDVGGATAIGVDRQEMRAFIMGSDANRASWSRSAELITTANIGSQSVSNADTLDGNHASAFATASHTHDYVPLSGNSTVNGAITFGKSANYGIRTNTNNYGRIGDSTNQFYEVHSYQIYENKTLLSNKYLGINANAVSATKATQDGNGNVISSTYLPLSSVSSYAHALKGWWTHGDTSKNCNDLRCGTVFAYNDSHGTPATGILVAFGEQDNANYTLQLQGSYSSNNLFFRNLQGDIGSWNDWREIIHSGNIGSQSVNYANTAGSAPASDVYAWAKASTKPTYTASEVGAISTSENTTLNATIILGKNDEYGIYPNTNNYCQLGRSNLKFWKIYATNGYFDKINDGTPITSSNISSQSVNYANSAGSAPASDVYAWAKASTPDGLFEGSTYTGNIDSYTESTLRPGKSYYISTTNISSSSALPFSGYGILTSYAVGSAIAQQIFRYNGSSKIIDAIYTRMYINNGWTSWSKVALTKV